MELTWLGTAGFQIKTGTHVLLIDPYLSRNGAARPRQTMVPSDLYGADRIFVSHGHFDHIFGIPAVYQGGEACLPGYRNPRIADQ